MVAKLAPKLNGIKEGTFVYLTIRDRWPKIVGKIIDHIHCNRRNFMEKHGEDADADVKAVIHELSEMRYRMMTDKPLEDLNDTAPDRNTYNQILEEYRTQKGPESVTWYKSVWLFVECYLYRRIYGAFEKTTHLKTFDPFAEQKNASFLQFNSYVSEAVNDLSYECSLGVSDDSIRKALNSLIRSCLWSNRCDLSLSGGEHTTHDHVDLTSRDKFIVANDIPAVVDIMCNMPQKNGIRRFDLVFDNAGLELIGDITLVMYLLQRNLVDKVVLHGKSIPWFVSDVTPSDWSWTLDNLSKISEKAATLVADIRLAVESGKIELRFSPFWTSPFPYCEMQEEYPDLYKDFQENSSLLLLKGDLNYRKLIGDRDWDYTVSFETALSGFTPCPLVAFRTLKAETVAGLSQDTVDQLKAEFGEKNDWLVTGEYGLVQFHVWGIFNK